MPKIENASAVLAKGPARALLQEPSRFYEKGTSRATCGSLFVLFDSRMRSEGAKGSASLKSKENSSIPTSPRFCC